MNIRLRWPGMRYTKIALLIFGTGLIAGFVAVVGEIPRLELPSSAAMAFGLMLIPAGLFADGHGIVVLRWIAAKFSRRKPPPRARSRAPTKPSPVKKPPAKPTAARNAPRKKSRSAAATRRKRR